MTKEELHKSTMSNIFGEWSYKNEQIDLKVVISQFNNTIAVTLNGNEDNIRSDGHWFGDHFMFPPNYYTRFADKHQMIFGKQKSGIVGDHEWEYILTRIK